jgi:hypothetical protein
VDSFVLGYVSWSAAKAGLEHVLVRDIKWHTESVKALRATVQRLDLREREVCHKLEKQPQSTRTYA